MLPPHRGNNEKLPYLMKLVGDEWVHEYQDNEMKIHRPCTADLQGERCSHRIAAFLIDEGSKGLRQKYHIKRRLLELRAKAKSKQQRNVLDRWI